MSLFEPFSQDFEVIGSLLLTYKTSFYKENYADIYAECGLDDIEPNQWYRFEKLTRVVNRIAEREGNMMDFVSIGVSMGLNVPLPPEFEKMPFENVLMAISQAYTHLARGTDPGYYRLELVEPNHVKLTVRVPFPDDMNYGGFYGYAKRYLPKGTHFTVSYDPDLPTRENGAQHTVYHIKWQ